MLVSALKHQRLLSPYVRLFVEIAVLYTTPLDWPDVVCGLGCPSYNLPACLLCSSITDVCHPMWEILGNR